MASHLIKTINYKTVGNLAIPLDLYLPSDAKNLPVVIWFHGAGLLQGCRNRVPPHFIQAMHSHGFAFVSPDYCLAPQATLVDIFEDVKDCIAFIRSPHGLVTHTGPDVIDPTRLPISGGSAGGYLALLAGLHIDPKPQVIAPIYPITDPFGTFFITPQPAPWGPPVKSESVAEFMNPAAEAVANNPADSKRSNSYFWMLQEANLAKLLQVPEERSPEQDLWRVGRSIRQRRLPPTYLVHGDADLCVGVEQTDEVIGVMVGEGLEVVVERLHNVDHLFDMVDGCDMSGMYKFMMTHLS